MSGFAEIRGKRLKEILDVWINTAYLGERPRCNLPWNQNRTPVPPPPHPFTSPSLAEADPEIFAAVQNEYARQARQHRADRLGEFHQPRGDGSAGLLPDHKYAEGYPHKRWYGGCENVDIVEELAIARAKQLF